MIAKFSHLHLQNPQHNPHFHLFPRYSISILFLYCFLFYLVKILNWFLCNLFLPKLIDWIVLRVFFYQYFVMVHCFKRDPFFSILLAVFLRFLSIILTLINLMFF